MTFQHDSDADSDDMPIPVTNLVKLFDALSTLISEMGYVPDAVMGAMNDASLIVGRSVIEAPVTTESDIAAKFRFAATLIEDTCGLMCDEPHAVQSAVAGLVGFRHAEHQKQFGRIHPFYADVAA